MNIANTPGHTPSVQEVNTPADWKPESWQDFPALQQATYPDQEALAAALSELAELPPLVTSWEIISLREQIAEPRQGNVSCYKVVIVPRISGSAVHP